MKSTGQDSATLSTNGIIEERWQDPLAHHWSILYQLFYEYTFIRIQLLTSSVHQNTMHSYAKRLWSISKRTRFWWTEASFCADVATVPLLAFKRHWSIFTDSMSFGHPVTLSISSWIWYILNDIPRWWYVRSHLPIRHMFAFPPHLLYSILETTTKPVRKPDSMCL